MDLISDIDLVKLEEELKSEKLNFNDVANYISGLNIDEVLYFYLNLKF